MSYSRMGGNDQGVRTQDSPSVDLLLDARYQQSSNFRFSRPKSKVANSDATSERCFARPHLQPRPGGRDCGFHARQRGEVSDACRRLRRHSRVRAAAIAKFPFKCF